MYFHNSDKKEGESAINPNEELDVNFNKINKETQNIIINYNKKIDNNINKILILEKTTCFASKDEPQNQLSLNEKGNLLVNPIMNQNLLEKLNQENKETKIKKELKKCGRKRERTDDNGEKSEHNKFSDDNIRRKCKHLVLKYSLEFINSSIKNKYNGNIGNGILKKELQALNQKQKTDTTINFNKNFLAKTLGEIFSENISGRITNLPADHNKLLIINLMNEEDEEKKNYFTKLFKIPFYRCLKHFNEQEIIPELIGLKCFSEIKDDIIKKYPKDGKDYYTNLKYYFDHFEEITMKKKPRKSRKQNIIKDN